MTIDLLKKINVKQRASGLNARAKQKGTEAVIGKRMLAQLVLRSGGVCAWCGCDLHEVDHIDIDHVLPFRLGGDNETSNLVLSCPDCNKRKSDKHPVTFAQEQQAQGISTSLIVRVLSDYDADSTTQESLF